MPASIHQQLAMQIVETLKSICDHDINYIDTYGKISASTNPARTGDFHEAGYQAARSGEIMVIKEDSPSKGIRKGINLPIRFHGETVAVIGITGEPDEVSRYAYLAQRITLLLLREHEIDMKDRNNQAQINYLVRALTRNEPVHPDFQQDILRKNKVQEDRCDWRVIVFRLDHRYNLSNISMIEAELHQAFERMNLCLYTYCYPDEYVLFAEEEKVQKYLYIFREIASHFSDFMKIGIGRKGKFGQIYHSYLCAVLAIQSLPFEKHIMMFDELDLEILLASVSENARNAFLDKCLKDLTEEDFKILEVYFASDQSLKQTSERMFMHVNTLQYRLNRIYDRCGYQPRSFHDAVILYTALKLRKR